MVMDLISFITENFFWQKSLNYSVAAVPFYGVDVRIAP